MWKRTTPLDKNTAVGGSIANDVATVLRILCSKRKEHEADPDFGMVLHWLRELTNRSTARHCSALVSGRRTNAKIISGRPCFTYSGIQDTHYSTFVVRVHHHCSIYHMPLLVLFQAKQ